MRVDPQQARGATECADAEFVYCLLADGTFVLAPTHNTMDLTDYRNTFVAFGRIDAESSRCA